MAAPQSRVLVVEDSKTIGTMLRIALWDAGLAVTIADTAEAALEKLSTEPFDLLLVDKNLPGMSGVDLIRKVRELSPVPVVLMTAFGSADSAAELLNLGIEAYIEKPFNPIWAVPELLGRILAKQKPGWTPSGVVAVAPAAASQAASSRELQVLVGTSDERLPSKLAIPRPAQMRVLPTLPELLKALVRERVDLLVIDVASFTGGPVAIVKEVVSVAPFVTCAVISDPPTLGETKMLIELGVTCMVGRDLNSDTAQSRIRNLVSALQRASPA